MEVESVKCECCGLPEDCTENYIGGVKAEFAGKWLCGLCADAVRDELGRTPPQQRQQKAAAAGRSSSTRKSREEAIREHMAFCRKHSVNPAVRVADGMRQMLRRRSGHLSSSSSSSSSTTMATKHSR